MCVCVFGPTAQTLNFTALCLSVSVASFVCLCVCVSVCDCVCVCDCVSLSLSLSLLFGKNLSWAWIAMAHTMSDTEASDIFTPCSGTCCRVLKRFLDTQSMKSRQTDHYFMSFGV